MSARKNIFPILPDGEQALNELAKQTTTAILVEANNQAHKDGHPYIDKTYIEKASKKVRIINKKEVKVQSLRIFLVLLVPLIFFEMAVLRDSGVLAIPVGLQISMWVLPIFSIVFVAFLIWAFWDYIS